MASNEVLVRNEVPEELTWRLEDIFATDAAWEEEFTAVSALAKKASNYAGTLNDGADALLAVLVYHDHIYERAMKLYTYAHMRYDQDTTNSFYQDMNSRIQTLATNISAALSFLTPEILSLSEETIEQYLTENTELQLYKQSLKEITLGRPHVLPAEQEALLAQMSEVTGTAANTFGMLNNADMVFPKVKNEDGEEIQLTHGNYIKFLESKDRSVREAAFKAMYGTYDKFKNTFAATLTGNVKKHNVNARIRNYESARHAAMENNFIPENVYDQLIETIHKHLPTMQRYIALRKKLLGVDELHMWDLFTPLVKEVDMKVSYEEAKETLVKALAPLGQEYQSIVQNGLDNRWVDVLENKGKRSGAYSSGAYGTNPYILMNWQDNMTNLFTLAHEFGHSVHSYYSRQTQPFVYGDYSIFVAEVASTCNEELLNDYLLKTIEDPQQKIYLLNHWLDGFRSTVFRQTMFAEFEHIIHQLDQNGESLTAERLTEVYYELNKKYFGDDMVVDSEIGLEWSRIPHFYYNYYVYQYATGQSAATALSKQILEEGAPAVERYINNFLKAGCSNFPIEVLKAAGVDMNVAKPIDDACKVFEERLNELEKLLVGNNA
ncbi:oligoendopeptidase F [Lysinibacillus piscis]|uniref:Oligopeptidase F n=1 Tax=Lysinibacillus piscis TaxID=2518931 RepID=A0ABQ5NHH6_9BACI|nr:oligoendopeptidase F [Lysinibacillus sp. KH24]GLC87740.1 oligoendopeptidase F [Lysinibacillus sp. KH24]